MSMIIEKWTPQMRDFIQQHLTDDTSSLILAANRYKGIDVPFAAEQIEARRRLKDKLPEWYANADLIMGGRVPAEQCSSEQTARYKRSIISGKSLCDLTGGMGVDFWYMTQGMERAIYTERSEMLCEATQHNLALLAADSSTIYVTRCGDGRDLPLPDVDVIYLDPARRASDGSRVYAIEDCEPNVVEWQDELLSHAHTLLVKLSPMIDLADMLRKLKNVTDVYIIGVRNECKEVLVKACGKSGEEAEESRVEESKSDEIKADEIKADEGKTDEIKTKESKSKDDKAKDDVRVHCVDFMPRSSVNFDFAFHAQQPVRVTSAGVMRYLYEPDVTLMKAQAFGSLCERYDVCQLDYETHLMTSDTLYADFPGRCFEVADHMANASRTLKQLRRSIPKANIATRNFVLTADQLRSRTGIKDGGDVYLFGAKVKDMGDTIIVCRKI